MKKFYQVITTGFIISGLVLASGVASADDHDMDREERIEKMHEQLGLSDEQKAQLKEHRQTHRKEMKDVRKQMKDVRESIRQELQSPDLDEAKIKSLKNDLNELMTRMSDHKLEGVLKVRQILTPQQFEKFNELTEDRRDKQKGSKKVYK